MPNIAANATTPVPLVKHVPQGYVKVVKLLPLGSDIFKAKAVYKLKV